MIKKELNMWQDFLGKKLLLIAMCLVLLTHGVILYYTLPKTYDAFVHMFFADHYSKFWFEPWEYRWYTGFLTTSYPPLVHQCIALLSKLFPLKIAFCIYAITIYEILIVGIYRFTKLFFSKSVAGIASIVAVLLSSLIETLHVYGQVPTLTGMAFLLNALPFIYLFFTQKKAIYFVLSLSFLSVVICSHHVTAIFGMVFFIFPTIFMALTDNITQAGKQGTIFTFFKAVIQNAFSSYKQFIVFGFFVLVLLVGLIFPYWYWSKTDPIIQVSIPHGSRDNFLLHPSSGLVFYVIPLALIFSLLPAIIFKITTYKRYIGWAVSFFVCILFGSGGTTPLPKIALGANAFNILTLDRFGFWASIIAIPFIASFILSFLDGEVKAIIVKKIGHANHFFLACATGFSYLLFIIFIFHLGSFRPLQPKEIAPEPIVNFLNRDDHLRWRYLTLGFGDQMAWLSANTMAATVDGNYHSARRLPELTTRPIERLENAKFSGNDGLSSLNNFLCNAEKYSLKYVFSNDRYYDPLLFYTGWNRTIQLENGIMVWEKGNISTIKPLIPKTIKPLFKKMWGTIPITSLCVVVLLTLLYLKKYKKNEHVGHIIADNNQYPFYVSYICSVLPLFFFTSFIAIKTYHLLFTKEKNTPTNTIINYYNHLDFQAFEKAFHFFKPSPNYPLDQYLLEKSVKDGGLLPSYAKLDSIYTKEISQTSTEATLQVFTRWRSSLGSKDVLDTMLLHKVNKNWYILPKPFNAEIPDEQMRSWNFTLFKKQGKRVISSFPTVKDDRVKKPFAKFLQANIVSYEKNNYIVGEILNADDIPINVALKAVIYYKNNLIRNFYPQKAFMYNLSPKQSSSFQIVIDNSYVMDTCKVEKIELYAETDVSERGYIQGSTTSYTVNNIKENKENISITMFNELPMDINIPGVLIAEKDTQGFIWQVQLVTHTKAIRSGMHCTFNKWFGKIANKAKQITTIPLAVFINNQPREIAPLQIDPVATKNNGIFISPHCFIADPLYLQ